MELCDSAHLYVDRGKDNRAYDIAVQWALILTTASHTTSNSRTTTYLAYPYTVIK